MKEHGKKLNKRALAFFVVNTKNDLPGCGLLSSGRRSSQCQTSEYCRFVDSGLPEFRCSVALLCLVQVGDIGMILALPILSNEIFLGIRLIVKGFDTTTLATLSAKSVWVQQTIIV